MVTGWVIRRVYCGVLLYITCLVENASISVRKLGSGRSLRVYSSASLRVGIILLSAWMFG